MASITRTFKVSPDLNEAIRLRAAALGYTSDAAYIKGLIRYDLMVQGKHSITHPYSHLRLEEQDRIDAKFLALTKEGVGVRGQWLETALEEVIGAERAAEIRGKLADECRKTKDG